MSGRIKGARGEREAIRALRAAGLDARGVKRERGAARDVDAVILLGAGRCVEVQIRRVEEESRLTRWVAEFVRPGAVLLYRYNRTPWAVLLREPADPVTVIMRDVPAFAALVKRPGVTL